MLLQGRHLIGECYRGSVPSLQRFAPLANFWYDEGGRISGETDTTPEIEVEEAAIDVGNP